MVRRLAVWAAVAALCGCSSEPPVGSVSGTVTLDGKPVTAGMVSLLAAAGGTPVMAEINAHGRYQATGVPAGEVLVGVIAPPADADPTTIKNQGGPKGPPAPPKPKVEYPSRYADPAASGLRVTVKPQAQGETTYDVPMVK